MFIVRVPGVVRCTQVRDQNVCTGMRFSASGHAERFGRQGFHVVRKREICKRQLKHPRLHREYIDMYYMHLPRQVSALRYWYTGVPPTRAVGRSIRRSLRLRIVTSMCSRWFQPLSLPLSLTTCPYFCSLVMSWSPCLTTSLYLRGWLVVGNCDVRALCLLFVLVSSPLGLDDTLDAIDGAWQSLTRYERREILVQPVHGNSKARRHALKAHNAIALKQLGVCS